MAAPGPSDTKQKQKFYKYNRGGGPDAARGAGGGRGRGRGKVVSGGAGGPSWVNEDGRLVNPLGRYRETPALIGMSAPGINVTTVQFKERTAEREVIEYLETIADEIEEPSQASTLSAVDDSDDVEKQLKQELEGMATGKSTRFRLCQHDTPCVIYINVLPPLDPVHLVQRIMERVESTGRSPFKFVKRLVPITAVSTATLNQASILARPIVAAGFATEDNRPLKFAIQPNSRNSNRIDRLELIKKVADEVVALGQGHSVDLSNADRTILIEIDKNCMGMSVVQHYDRFKRFNPSSVAESLAKAKAEQPAQAPVAQAPVAQDSTTSARPTGQASAQNHANRSARAAALNAMTGISVGSEKRKADVVENVDVEMGDGTNTSNGDKASKQQRLE